MAEPLARLEGFEGFEAASIWQNHWQGLRGLKGSFGPLEKKDLARQSPEPTVCATPPTVSHRAQRPQSSKCEVLECLQRPAHRAQGPQSSKCEVLERLQRPVWQNHWQGSRGLRGLKGSFGPLEKKDLARQSPEPTVCATPPTVSHRAQRPQSSARFWSVSNGQRTEPRTV